MSKKKEVEVDEKDVVASLKEFLNTEDSWTGIPPWFLHTGNYALDYIVSGKADGTGGWPGGTIVELFGDPSSGKTMFINKAAAEIQKLDGVFVLADAESRWDAAFAKIHGVDPDQIVLFYPETVEDFAVNMHKILEKWGSKKRIVAGLDSLAILSTIKEMDDVSGGDIKADQGRKAQKIKAAMRVLRSLIRETGAILLVSNHVIANPNSYLPNAKITPGGGGVPFQASVRVEFLRPAPIVVEKKQRPIGVTVHVKVTKNSVSPPFGECRMDLHWARGISPYSGLLELAKDIEVIEQNGAWYAYGDQKFQSKDFESIAPLILKDGKWTKPYFLEV